MVWGYLKQKIWYQAQAQSPQALRFVKMAIDQDMIRIAFSGIGRRVRRCVIKKVYCCLFFPASILQSQNIQ